MRDFIKKNIHPESILDVFAQAPVAMGLLMGKDFVVQVANPTIIEIWGKGDSIIGMPVAEALPEIVGQGFMDLLNRVYDTGQPFYGEKVPILLTRNGIPVESFYDFVYTPVFNHDKQVVGVSVVATDVRSEVESRQKMVEAELRFKEMMLNADYSIAIYLGEDFVIELANDQMLETWGKTKKVIGMRLIDAIPELKGQPFIEQLRDVYETGKTYAATEDPATLEINGELKTSYYNFTYRPLRNADGKIYGIINMAVDVTEMVNARERAKTIAEELQKSESRYKHLAEAMPHIVWTTNPNGLLTYANEKMWDYVDSAEEANSSAGIAAIFHHEDIDNIVTIWNNAVAERKKFEVEHRSYNRKTGEYLWFLTRAIPELDSEGNIVQWIGSSTDINEFKILENQKDTFLGIASHELKTPLTSIKIYAQVLERALAKSGDEKNAVFARKMDEQVVRLTSLIGDLLDVTKINTGRIQINEQLFDFSELVAEIAEEQQLVARHKILHKCKPVGMIVADRNRIGQVITNLISNALKYSPDAEEIIIYTDEDDDNVQFCVHDFGIGMPEDKKDRVFEQYYRVSGDEQHTFAGLGLGLYIASEIIQRSNGKIWVNSVLGKGSTFCFSLPKHKKNS